MTYTILGSIPKNLELARELTAHLISEMHTLHSENAHIEVLLYAGDEYELYFLPGDTIDVIVNRLIAVVKLSREPMPKSGAGLGQDADQSEASQQRADILLFAQVALALLDSDETGCHRTDAHASVPVPVQHFVESVSASRRGVPS
jgi:hypothetical protein